MTDLGPPISAAKIVYIDPDDCGSTVGYRVEDSTDVNKNYSGIDFTIDLSDCNRTIRWSFYINNDDNTQVLQKLDNVLDLLKEARVHLVKCIKKKEKHAKIVQAKKPKKEQTTQPGQPAVAENAE